MTERVRGLSEMQRKYARIQNILKNGNKNIYEKIGDEAIRYILTRTALSIDANGKRFEPYTSKYAKKKGNHVDLKISGKMLNSIVRTAYAKFCRIYVRADNHGKISTYDLGLIHNFGVGKQPERKFMGLTKRESEEIKKILREYIVEEIEKIK
jgi:phage gpG-like protein